MLKQTAFSVNLKKQSPATVYLLMTYGWLTLLAKEQRLT